MSAILEVRDLVKEYPGVKALQGVDLDVQEGEVHCLLGPNGAGKLTLIKCVSGAVEPTSGEIIFAGEPLPLRRSQGLARPRRRHDLPGARPGGGPLGGRVDLPRPRAAARPADRPQAHAAGGHRPPCAPGPRGHPTAREGAGAAPGRPADRLDRPRALARHPAADHGRALRDPRRGRDRDAVRRGPPAHRRARRRHLHHAPARRDPPHRRPGDGACRRAHDGRRASRPTPPPTTWSRT